VYTATEPEEVEPNVTLYNQKDAPRALQAGPERVREVQGEDIAPPNMGEIQRRVIELELEGETIWREFDIVRLFETEDEAREYAENAENRQPPAGFVLGGN